jgi:N-glycosylase/DNA lyase
LSKAEKVYKIINKENKEQLLNSNRRNLSNFLKGNCRFHNNKASYIVEARNFIDYIKKLPKDGIEARDFIVQNVKGLNYKEASHFLRNIGYKNLAIIDGHILNSLKEFGVIKSNARPKNKKEYLNLENKIKDFSKDIKIPMDELDLLLWSMKTGKVLK